MAGNRANVAETPEYLRPEIVSLLKLLTEATRARPQGVPGAFIRPAGTDQAEADYHHFVFGQRGSGKSSLLRYLESQMMQEHRVSVWIDQEIFTDLAYPDVLVSCVLEITENVAHCLRRNGSLESRRGVIRIFGKSRMSPGGLEERLARVSENLRVLKFAPLDAEIQWVHKVASSDQLDALGSVKAAGVEGSIGVRKSKSSELTRMQAVVTSKGEYLERSLVDFRRILKDAAGAANGGFIFVDDLYLIARSDQPRVLGYLHRLLKDTGLWLKVGSIRHYTNNYVSSDPPVGMQTRHDAHEVALDRQFGLFDTTKSFLEAILTNIALAANVDSSRLFTKGALYRLMLASGGVARDYLLLARGAIEEAREHGPGTKSGSNRVIVEDVNSAAGKIAPTKLNDLRQDTPDRAEAIEDRVIDLTNFCRDRRFGYFLVDTRDRALMQDMNALQHLRFAHLLFQSETIPDRQSQRFNVYLLDLAQLAYQRAIQGVDFEGWVHRERRRNRKLVYSVDWVSQQRPAKQDQPRNNRLTSGDNQGPPTLFDGF